MTSVVNPFVNNRDEYTRDLNIGSAYVIQSATYLQLMTGDTFEDCVKFVKDTIKPGGVRAAKDPEIISLEQRTPGNRLRYERTFMEYVGEVIDTNRILSPSMVCYERPEVNKSISAAFIEGGINDRKVAKKEMFVARQKGDKILEYIKDCEQNSKKIGINSVSGMHGFSGNILYVASGHSSLTSMCRTATGYGNANNERFISGSRHYWDSEIVIANILTIITNTDYAQLEQVMDKYGIVYPSAEQALECVERSTQLYWRNEKELDRIYLLLTKLSPSQRAAFVYSGDMYHLAKFNPELVREFLGALTEAQTGKSVEDPKATIGLMDDDLKAFVNLLCAHILDTYVDDKDEEQSKTHDWLRENDPTGYQELAATARNTIDVIARYADMIRALWVPKHMPPTVANIRSIIRRTALASDTDSTIFTTQEWVKWYTGSYKRTREGDAIWYAMTYLTTQCIIHVLAQLSGNLGVTKKDLHRLAMKNEYAFPVFSLTSRAKHYYAYMSAREGNVYSEYDDEIKGVALRSSLVPPHVIKHAKQLMHEVLTAADKSEQLSLRYVYGVIYEFEQDIITSVAKGESRYLKTAQVKEKYKNMDSSPYQHYLLWEEVFAPKYGNTPPPPYQAIKVPLEVNNKTEMVNWLAGMEDKELAARFTKWLLERNKDKMSMLLLPTSILGGIGMPPEIMSGVNLRKLSYETLEAFYLILESLGVYQIDENYVRLVSDVYTPDTKELTPL